MGIFLIILIVIILLWPQISRFLQRMAMRKMEDMVRKAAGQPTRKEEERRRKQERRAESRGERSDFYGQRRTRRHPARLLQLVAVDVEFVEIKSYSASTLDIDPEGRQRSVIIEEQISDVEYTEIRIS